MPTPSWPKSPDSGIYLPIPPQILSLTGLAHFIRIGGRLINFIYGDDNRNTGLLVHG